MRGFFSRTARARWTPDTNGTRHGDSSAGPQIVSRKNESLVAFSRLAVETASSCWGREWRRSAARRLPPFSRFVTAGSTEQQICWEFALYLFSVMKRVGDRSPTGRGSTRTRCKCEWRVDWRHTAVESLSGSRLRAPSHQR